jgi:hypothetical protein
MVKKFCLKSRGWRVIIEQAPAQSESGGTPYQATKRNNLLG